MSKHGNITSLIFLLVSDFTENDGIDLKKKEGEREKESSDMGEM